MSSITLYPNNDFNYAEVDLPTSKSLSNRALIIRELSTEKFSIHRLSASDDTKNLIKSLDSLNKMITEPRKTKNWPEGRADETEKAQFTEVNEHFEVEVQRRNSKFFEVPINVGAAGTNMRFLVSLLSIKPGKYVLTGNERIQQRPIRELVDCLRSLGAEIRYLKNEGFPPVEIIGKNLEGGKTSIDAGISSQFISSLLMIAPCLKNGLEIEMLHQVVSWPYIDMTLGLMNHFGIKYEKDINKIKISRQKYMPRNYQVEPDWSSAAFWFGIIANSKIGTKILLKNIHQQSLQGDRMAVEYFKLLDVQTKDTQPGILIEKTTSNAHKVHFGLIDEPDLFPVLAFCCAALQLKATFTGLQTLNFKESNRIEAVHTELQKTGAICQSGSDDFEITGYTTLPDKIIFDTYSDHRIAMAASIFIGSCKEITINDPEVVSKSYPGYWDDLKNTGFIL